jgi:hypothetical protein
MVEFLMQALGEFLRLLRILLATTPAAEAKHFLGLRYAQASAFLTSPPGLLRKSHLERPPV